MNEEVVLVGTDFSDVSAQALEQGRQLASRLGLVIELIHVREGFRQERGWVPRPADLVWLEKAGVEPEGLIVRTGTPWLEIVRYAQERPAGMIVVGTHGATGFQPLTLGATAARLAILSPRPVVMVGAKSKNGEKGRSPSAPTPRAGPSAGSVDE